MFSPSKNRFELINSKERVHGAKEVWMTGKALLIAVNKFKEIK
jgi:hypothetical protein